MDVYGEEDEEDANYCADSDEGEYIQEEVAVDRKEYDEEDDNTDNKYDKDILPKSLRNLDEDSIKKMIKDYNGNESPKVGVDNVENSKKEGFNDYNNNIIIQENYSKIKNDDELQKKGKRSGNGRKKGKRFK